MDKNANLEENNKRIVQNSDEELRRADKIIKKRGEKYNKGKQKTMNQMRRREAIAEQFAEKGQEQRRILTNQIDETNQNKIVLKLGI